MTSKMEENEINFDFEDKIKDLIDKSIATMSAEERRLQAKKVNLGVDVRHGTVVCRHWLNKLCLKGGNCEFLHQLDLDRLPECQNGMNCEIEGCELRHEDEDEKFQCRLFRQGFCPNGPNCPYRHKLLDASKRPENADLVQIGESSNTEGGSAGDSDNYRTALCRHFSTKGSCPYGAKCLYAHGQHQLRRRTAGTISAPKRNLITPSTELKVVDEEVHLKELQALITKGLIVAVPNTQMLEQCLNLGIFAMPMHQQGLAMGVVPGSIIFAADRSTEQVHGIFEATNKATMNNTGNLKEFPCQFKVRELIKLNERISQEQVNRVLRTVAPRAGRSKDTRALSAIATQSTVRHFLDIWKRTRDPPPPLRTSILLGDNEKECATVLQDYQFVGALNALGTKLGRGSVLTPEPPSNPSKMNIESDRAGTFVLAQRLFQEILARKRIQKGWSPLPGMGPSGSQQQQRPAIAQMWQGGRMNMQGGRGGFQQQNMMMQRMMQQRNMMMNRGGMMMGRGRGGFHNNQNMRFGR